MMQSLTRRVASAPTPEKIPRASGLEAGSTRERSTSGSTSGSARGSTRGFTLMEVLVATLIMAIAVAGSLSGISAAARNASRLTQYDRATILARQKMDELLVDPNLPHGASQDGVFDPEQSGSATVGWHAAATAFEGGPGPGVVDRIELEIWWQDGATRRVFALEGYRRGRLAPGETPPRGSP